MSPSSPENPINPWESSLGKSDPQLDPIQNQPFSTDFSGTLDATVLANYFNQKLGCVIPLVIFSAVVWIGVLSRGLGVTGIAIVGVSLLVLVYFIWNRYVGRNPAKRLMKYRPWLKGETHGVACLGRLTVWHEDFCMQTSLEDYMINHGKGWICYPDPETPYPWLMIPSTFFYKEQWFELLNALGQEGELTPKIVPAPPAEAWECMLEMSRSLELKNRSRALRFRPNRGLALFFIVLNIWGSFIPRTFGFGAWTPMVTPTMLGIWLLTEVSRILWAHYSVFREYRDPKRPAYRKKPLHRWPQIQWFNRQQVLVSDVNHWLLCPVRYIERVRISYSWIEFLIGGESMLFHREGFANEQAWQGACQDARAIQQELIGNQA